MSSKDLFIMVLGMIVVGGPYAVLVIGSLTVNANEKIYGRAAKYWQGQTAHA